MIGYGIDIFRSWTKAIWHLIDLKYYPTSLSLHGLNLSTEDVEHWTH